MFANCSSLIAPCFVKGLPPFQTRPRRQCRRLPLGDSAPCSSKRGSGQCRQYPGIGTVLLSRKPGTPDQTVSDFAFVRVTVSHSDASTARTRMGIAPPRDAVGAAARVKLNILLAYEGAVRQLRFSTL